MAKKGGPVQLQVEVETEEDWDKLVERIGLIVCDVYSEWCGPCTGMAGNLRKLKLEIGGDILHLALAKSDRIQCLERFRNKSEPTWMFISGGKMIRLMFGANAPRLVGIITEELDKEKRALADKTPREGIRFDQLTDEEQEREDEETEIREEAERIEREAREIATNERRTEVVNNLMDFMKEFNFVMIWPHVTNEGLATIFEAFKETELSVYGKPVKVQLTEHNVNEMLYFYKWHITDDALEELLNREVSAFLFQAPIIDFEGNVIDIMRSKIYGLYMEPPGDEDCICQKLTTVIEKDVIEEDIAREESEDEVNEVDVDGDPGKREAIIPGVFVPDCEETKVICMRILFPLVTMKFDLPEPEPIPPHLIIAFDAFKKNEILQLAAEYPVETMKFGFFTSTDAETAKLLAKTADQFNKISAPPTDAKLIVQVSKRKSEPLLSYALLGPAYVSANCVIGEKECALLFPEGYDEPEPEVIEEEVKKKHKKRARGSKASGSSSSSSKTSVESEGHAGAADEVLEDVEEGEEYDELEPMPDDFIDADLLKDYVDTNQPVETVVPVAVIPVEAPPVSTEASLEGADKSTSPMDEAEEG